MSWHDEASQQAGAQHMPTFICGLLMPECGAIDAESHTAHARPCCQVLLGLLLGVCLSKGGLQCSCTQLTTLFTSCFAFSCTCSPRGVRDAPKRGNSQLHRCMHRCSEGSFAPCIAPKWLSFQYKAYVVGSLQLISRAGHVCCSADHDHDARFILNGVLCWLNNA